MRWVWVYALLLVMVLNFGCSLQKSFNSHEEVFTQEASTEIVGGRAVGLNDMVARSTVGLYLKMENSGQVHLFCTGTLISPIHIVTAAHCVLDVAEELNKNLSQFGEYVQVGFGLPKATYKNQDSKTFVKIREAFPYEGYKSGEITEHFPDIAVLKLERRAPRGYQPVSLADHRYLTRGQKITVAGYGLVNGIFGLEAGELRMVEMEVANPNFSQTQFTHKFSLFRSTCSGDSGGPAYVKLPNQALAVLGVTSWSVTGCTAKGAYTSIPAFRDWILTQIRR